MIGPDYIMINARGSIEAPWGAALHWNTFDAVPFAGSSEIIVHYSSKKGRIRGSVKMPFIDVLHMKETGEGAELCRLALEKHDAN